MTDIGKALFISGLALAALGGLLWLLGRAGFQGLPGDISFQGERVKVVFPIVTCLVLSLLLTLILNLAGRR
ncbi:MAG: DUF2905 family protein [Sumerlaeia bacterium]